ncbi:MAG: hypothetical protein IKU84_04365 [Clostridia bacterium]|nr:hypothetical protein [Clostridia bacterium]
MSKTIKAIEITFENIDYIEIPTEYFESYDHKKSDSGILYGIEEKSVDFVLRKEVLGVQRLLDSNMEHVFFQGNKTLFDRIAEYSDIVNITVIYADGSGEMFIVEWEDEDDSEFRNKLQKTTLTENGDLHVVIRR